MVITIREYGGMGGGGEGREGGSKRRGLRGDGVEAMTRSLGKLKVCVINF